MRSYLDKQVNVQIEILKIIFRGSRKPMRKVYDENERMTPYNYFVVEEGIYVAVSEEWWNRF